MKNFEEIDISNFLPHKAPFLMVDKVISIGHDHVTTIFQIQEDCIFQKNNVFIEVGMIENAAQTCSAILGKSYFDQDDKEGKKTKLIGFISALKKVHIHSCPEVGTMIRSEASIVSRFEAEAYKISSMKCTIYEGEKELLSCEMNLFIQELN